MNLASLFPWRQQEDEDERLAQPLLSEDEIRSIFLRCTQCDSSLPLMDVAGRQAGDARSIHRGYGLDYEESRPYQPGDETRFMNWRLSARTGDLQMKVFREERKPSAFILIDRRNSMRFGTQSQLKLTQVLRTATTISAHALQANQAVSIVRLDQQLHWSDAESSESGILNQLYESAVAAPPMDQMDNSPDLLKALDLLLEKRVAGSRIYLLSDFIDLCDLHRNRLVQLASDCKLFSLLFYDPVEYRMPKAGRLRFAGTNGPITLDTADPQLQGRYHAMAKEHFEHRKALFKKLGIPCQMISTREEEPTLEAL